MRVLARARRESNGNVMLESRNHPNPTLCVGRCPTAPPPHSARSRSSQPGTSRVKVSADEPTTAPGRLCALVQLCIPLHTVHRQKCHFERPTSDEDQRASPSSGTIPAYQNARHPCSLPPLSPLPPHRLCSPRHQRILFNRKSFSNRTHEICSSLYEQQIRKTQPRT